MGRKARAASLRGVRARRTSEALRVHQVEAQRGRGAAGGLVVGGEGGVEAHECKYHVVRARRDRARAAGGHRQEAQVRAEHESHVERRRRERKRGAAMRYDLQVAAGAAEVDELLEAEGARPAQVAHGVVRLEAERLLPVMVEARKGLLRLRAGRAWGETGERQSGLRALAREEECAV
eukprot:4183578-Prymnesium_polylepis.1